MRQKTMCFAGASFVFNSRNPTQYYLEMYVAEPLISAFLEELRC